MRYYNNKPTKVRVKYSDGRVITYPLTYPLSSIPKDGFVSVEYLYETD